MEINRSYQIKNQNDQIWFIKQICKHYTVTIIALIFSLIDSRYKQYCIMLNNNKCLCIQN